MYEAVYAHPDGDSTAARLAATADRYGYDGVIARAVDADPDHERLRESLPIDLVDAVEVVAPDPQHASGAVGNARSERTVVCVRGGTDALNRFAVEQPRVDVLARPFVGDGGDDGGDGDVNHVLAKAAANNGVHVEVNLGPALRRHGGGRVRHLAKLRRLKRILDHYDAPYVVSAAADSHLRLRAPRELAAVGEEIGLGDAWTRRGLDAWRDLVARNRKRLSESFIAPGVERGRYEEVDRGSR